MEATRRMIKREIEDWCEQLSQYADLLSVATQLTTLKRAPYHIREQLKVLEMLIKEYEETKK